VTFLATHLAAALADRGLRTALVDMDPAFSGLSAALGIDADGEVRAIGDLLPVIEELSPSHVDQALFRHSRGFGVLLASGPGERPGPAVPPGLYSASVALLAGDHDMVVLHVGRPLEPVARSAIELADRVLLVTGLDLLSVYGARRALAAFRADDAPDRFSVVVNRYRRSELTPGDAERILGVRPAAILRCDPAVGRAQDRGELLPPRSRRAWRDVKALAGMLAAPGGTGAGLPGGTGAGSKDA
jgi:MinD-like ATPase involved in chromosome partitioning or flagellar assembly